MGGEAVANGDDVADWDGAERLDRRPRSSTFGGLDVLVNNAGILRDRMLVNMTEAEWDAVIRVHLKGTFAPTRYAAAYWREQAKAGEAVDARIINTSSTSGIFGNPGQTNYGAAKAGIADVHDHRGQGARPLRRDRQRDRARRPHPHDREPRRRHGRRPRTASSTARAPENIAPLVAWLARTRVQGRHRSCVPRRGRSIGIGEAHGAAAR